MKIDSQKLEYGKRRSQQGMTLAEILVALFISGVSIAGIVSGYIVANTSAERFGLSVAANSQASQRLEQIRSAKWDLSVWPAVDEIVATNFSNQVVILDSSWNGTNILYGTNIVQISMVSTNPPLKRVRVDCVWWFRNKLMTNTIETCRGPDQ